MKESESRRGENRKYLVFYLRVFNRLNSQILGYVANLSSKGLMLLSDSPIPEGEKFSLKMKLPIELTEKDTFYFDAVSKWCKEDENPDFYVTGLELKNISEEAEQYIKRLIKDFSY